MGGPLPVDNLIGSLAAVGCPGARCGQGVGPRHARHARRQGAAARGCAWLRSRRQAAPPLPSAVRRGVVEASGRGTSRAFRPFGLRPGSNKEHPEEGGRPTPGIPLRHPPLAPPAAAWPVEPPGRPLRWVPEGGPYPTSRRGPDPPQRPFSSIGPNRRQDGLVFRS